MNSDPLPPNRERALGMVLMAIVAGLTLALVALAIFVYVH